MARFMGSLGFCILLTVKKEYNGCTCCYPPLSAVCTALSQHLIVNIPKIINDFFLFLNSTTYPIFVVKRLFLHNGVFPS